MGRISFFVSDLHGHVDRYEKLVAAIASERPAGVFLGGDLLPHPASPGGRSFLDAWVAPAFAALRAQLGSAYPAVFLILGNDDPRTAEAGVLAGEARGLWQYVHGRKRAFGGHPVYGYACVPPTPFRLKDWERYDVSRYVDPGCLPPEEGDRTVAVPEAELRFGTIQRDLAALVGADPLERAVLLLHSPPYGVLDRAALDGRRVDGVPLDVHVGSIAIARLIETRQPGITLHGHVHESAHLTGTWRARIGRTHSFSAAHDGPELALVRFDPADPAAATRELL